MSSSVSWRSSNRSSKSSELPPPPGWRVGAPPRLARVALVAVPVLDDFDVVARLDAAVAVFAHDYGVPHHVANDLLVGAVKHGSMLVHRGARLHVVLDAVGVVVDTVPARAVGLRSRHEGGEREEESTLGTHRGSRGGE